MSKIPSDAPNGEPTEGMLRFLTGTGHFLLVGSLAFFIGLAIYDWSNPDSPYKHTFELIVAHFITGRLGNAGIGIKYGFPNLILVYQCFIQDLIIMCYLYPLFVKGYHKVGQIPVIGHHLEDAHRAATRHKHKIAPYGILGLLFFVMLPIFSTGPLVGVFLGYLIVLGTGITFGTVIVADLIMSFGYVYFFDYVNEQAPELTRWLIIVIIGLAILATLYKYIQRKRNPKPAPPTPEEAV